MKQALEQSYAQNQPNFARLGKRVGGNCLVAAAPEYRQIPVLLGETGIGKTACVKAFTADKGFEFVALDCSYMSVAALATFMYGAIEGIRAGTMKGCVLLIDNLDQADSDWKAIFDQYSENYFDAYVNMQDETNPDQVLKSRQQFATLPETLFLVGEQRPL
jgi:hypothetical protein